MLCTIIDQGRQDKPEWIDFVSQMMLTYNHTMIRSSITMTPYEATTPSSSIDVKNSFRTTSIIYNKIPRATHR